MCITLTLHRRSKVNFQYGKRTRSQNFNQNNQKEYGLDKCAKVVLRRGNFAQFYYPLINNEKGLISKYL